MRPLIKNLIIIILFSVAINIQSQNSTDGYSKYDRAMISLTKEVALRIKNNKKLNVAVWEFSTKYKKDSLLSKYIREDFNIHFTNAKEDLIIANRTQLEQIMKEHDLYSEGFINPKTAKKVGNLTAADAIITGTIDMGFKRLRLRIMIIDTETGEQFAAALRNLPIDENIKYILSETSVNNPKDTDNGKGTLRRGERYGDRSHVDENCEQKNIGDYCFENDTSKNYTIVLNFKNRSNNIYRRKQSYEKIALNSGESGCFTDIPSGTYKYDMSNFNHEGYMTIAGRQTSGSLKVERCKSIIYQMSNRMVNNNRSKYNTNTKNKQNKKLTVDDVIDFVTPIFKKKQ